MDTRETKEFLYGLVSEFFSGATVRWAKTKGVAPMPPYVTISCGYMKRDTFPTVNEDGTRCYGCSMRLEINVYTEGSSIEDGTGSSSYVYENTAVNDLDQFTRFIDSGYGLAKLHAAGVCIMQDTPINDVSELTGDTRYNYRAMAEFNVTYMETAAGEYGLYGEELPDPSGGGSSTHAGTDDYTISSVYIEADDNSGYSTFDADEDNIIIVDSEE